MHDDILLRFNSKIQLKENGCHEWIAGKDRDGYGQFFLNKKTVKAHRFSYELYKGKIKNGLQIDHLCRNRGCVNPKHLEEVTCKENVNRGDSYNGNKTHCPQGHEYTENNTYIRPVSGRNCKECNRLYASKKRHDYFQFRAGKGI